MANRRLIPNDDRARMFNSYNFTRRELTRRRFVHGFAARDMVQANVPKGREAGPWRGRVAVRASGAFNIQTPKEIIQGVGWKHIAD